MKNLRFLFCLILLYGYQASFGQTSNQGKLYIVDNTKFLSVSELNNLETGELFNDGELFLHSHLTNEGIFDYLSDSGITRFVGRDDQVISGSRISYFNNVYFENSSDPAPFLLTGTMRISGRTDFREGIVDNANFGGHIHFENPAGHENTSHQSHVSGFAFRSGDRPFVFPIGDQGYYRYAAISAPENAAEFKARYHFSNSDPLYSHQLKAGVLTEINNREYWTIQQEGSQEEDVLVTLSWSEETTPASMITAAQQDVLVIVRWDEARNMWVNEGGAIDRENRTVTTAVSGYGVFTFGTVKADHILPGGLTVYTAVTPNGDGINDYFFIDTPGDGSVGPLHVTIFNRWGVKVYESDDYQANGDVFDGFSRGRVTVGSEQLPSGTYYYILEYRYGGGNNLHKDAGFLYLSGN